MRICKLTLLELVEAPGAQPMLVSELEVLVGDKRICAKETAIAVPRHRDGRHEEDLAHFTLQQLRRGIEREISNQLFKGLA